MKPDDPDYMVHFRNPTGNVLTASFYETSDSLGGKQLEIVLRRTSPTAVGQTKTHDLRCDQDRLEQVVEHGNDLKARFAEHPERFAAFNMKQPCSVEQHGTWTVRYHPWADEAGKKEIVVRIEQIKADGVNEKRERFSCDLARLEEVAKHAVVFEHQRGHQRGWYAAVKLDELLPEEAAVQVKVVKWARHDEARDFVAVNRKDGYAFYQEPFRRQQGGEGYTFPIYLSDIPKLAPELGPEIRFREREQERVGPGLLLGVWYHQTRTPTPGMDVKVYPGRDEQSREFIDYRIVPMGIDNPSGKNAQPLHVIVNTDSRTIKEVHHNGGRAQERFRELKAVALEQQQQKRIEHAKLMRDQDVNLSGGSMPGGYR